MPLDRLEALIPGGLPPRTSVLLDGPPGAGKSSLALQILGEHVRGGGAGLCITTEVAPARLFEQVERVAPHARDALWVLDACSWRTGGGAPAPNVLAVSSLASLSDLSIRLSDALELSAARGLPLVVVFDTPSSLALHASAEAVLRFFDLAFAKVKAADGTLLLPVERGVHPPSFLASLSYMCDGVIEMRIDEEDHEIRRFLRVQAMRTAHAHSTRWSQLLLDARGLALATEERPRGGVGAALRYEAGR